MQIFELTQRKKTNEISYDSLERAAAEKKSRSPNFATGTGPGVQPQMTVTPTMRTAAASPAPASSTAANFATGTGPGVQPQYTATPRMKGTPQTAPAKQLPPPAANAVANTAPAPELQTIDAPPQLPAPKTAATKQIGMNDPNVVDVVAKEKPTRTVAALPAPAPAETPAPATSPEVAPTARQASQGVQSYQDTAAIPATPTPAPKTSTGTKPAPVAAAPSTPGVKGSRMAAIAGSLGNKLAAHNAASVGLSMPDTGDNNAYGDQRAAAAKAAAPLISQQARQELAKWNQALTAALQQNGVASPAQLPTPAKQALARSLMNQVYTNFLQGKLGKEYRKLSELVDGKAAQEAAAQVAKLDNAIKAILNFNAPKSAPAAELQRWQDLSQASYDMRSLLEFQPKSREGSAGKQMPLISTSPGGGFKIGNYSLNMQDTTDKLIGKIIGDQTVNGKLPAISINPQGRYQIGNHELTMPTGAEQKAVKLIKQQVDGASTGRAPQQTQPVAQPTAQQPPQAPNRPLNPGVTQALIKLGYSPQQASAMSQRIPPNMPEQDAIKLALSGKLNVAESLTWSRGFDPSQTLLKKIRQL